MIHPLKRALLPTPGASREGCHGTRPGPAAWAPIVTGWGAGAPVGIVSATGSPGAGALGQSQSAFAVSHNRETTYSTHVPACTSPLSSHTHTLTHFFTLQASSHLTQPTDYRREVSCAPGQGTSSSGGWLGVLQAVRALSNG